MQHFSEKTPSYFQPGETTGAPVMLCSSSLEIPVETGVFGSSVTSFVTMISLATCKRSMRAAFLA